MESQTNFDDLLVLIIVFALFHCFTWGIKRLYQSLIQKAPIASTKTHPYMEKCFADTCNLIFIFIWILDLYLWNIQVFSSELYMYVIAPLSPGFLSSTLHTICAQYFVNGWVCWPVWLFKINIKEKYSLIKYVIYHLYIELSPSNKGIKNRVTM